MKLHTIYSTSLKRRNVFIDWMLHWEFVEFSDWYLDSLLVNNDVWQRSEVVDIRRAQQQRKWKIFIFFLLRHESNTYEGAIFNEIIRFCGTKSFHQWVTFFYDSFILYTLARKFKEKGEYLEKNWKVIDPLQCRLIGILKSLVA